ncbi:nitrite reductase small subunit NirD [Halalkalibacter alkalisediminis]|uniref:Nitrite reductase small subunit NirD n=1 Tax=Halalkalibacter alkalisediminis TaxID=935616 RepID=A0ABV6NH78_9BACI|nr:nitrite reductase small subunit NirD [Halalkalibacter alkalisediminis]
MITTNKQIKIKNIHEFPVGIGQLIQIGEEEIAIFRLSNGNVRAIDNKSPHPKGGKLSDGLVSGEFLFCPIHDWKISLVDGVVQAPDQGKVKTYPVEIVGNDLFIAL